MTTTLATFPLIGDNAPTIAVIVAAPFGPSTGLYAVVELGPDWHRDGYVVVARHETPAEAIADALARSGWAAAVADVLAGTLDVEEAGA